MKTATQLWSRLPVLVRAVVSGFFVQIIGYLLLIATIPFNVEHLPGVPWAVVPLGLGLWAYWSYFGGRGWPKSTAALRARYRRSHPIEPGLRAIVALAGGFYALGVTGLAILQLAMRPAPPEALGIAAKLAGLPLPTAIPLALMTAFVVGVSEELSFRGYLQVPIEERHGPLLGHTVPALCFALAHGLDLRVLPVFFTVSLGWSFIAWRVDSIRPGIVLHTLIDAGVFLWVIFDLAAAQGVLRDSISSEGLTAGYLALAVGTAACLVGALAAFARLQRKARESSTDGLAAAE